MSRASLYRVVWGAAVAAWLAGVIGSALTWRSLRAEARRAGERRALLGRIADAAEEAQALTAVRAAAQALAGPLPTETVDDGLAARPGVRVAERREQAVALEDGWRWRLVELVFEEAPIGEVLALVAAAERATPPWRLRAIDLRASAHATGAGRVAVTLGQLQPEGAPAPAAASSPQESAAETAD